MYVKDQSWWEYKPDSDTSWVWRKVCKVKEKFAPVYVNNRWTLSKDQIYYVKTGYIWLQGTKPKVRWKNWVWNTLNVPKHSFIAWIIQLDKMNTKEKLKQHGIVLQTALCVQQ